MLLLSARFGALSERIGPRPLMSLGLAAGRPAASCSPCGSAPDASYFGRRAARGGRCSGSGLSCAVAPLTAAVLAAAPDQLAGAASGINNATARSAGLLAVAVDPGGGRAVPGPGRRPGRPGPRVPRRHADRRRPDGRRGTGVLVRPRSPAALAAPRTPTMLARAPRPALRGGRTGPAPERAASAEPLDHRRFPRGALRRDRRGSRPEPYRAPRPAGPPGLVGPVPGRRGGLRLALRHPAPAARAEPDGSRSPRPSPG